jgi:hypothetical protein
MEAPLFGTPGHADELALTWRRLSFIATPADCHSVNVAPVALSMISLRLHSPAPHRRIVTALLLPHACSRLLLSFAASTGLAPPATLALRMRCARLRTRRHIVLHGT